MTDTANFSVTFQDRPGLDRKFYRKPNPKLFADFHKQIEQVCKRHNTTEHSPYFLVDINWSESHFIFVEVHSSLTVPWLLAVLRKVQASPRWAVCLEGIPKGYAIVFAGGVQVSGVPFKGAKTIDDAVQRANHALQLDDLIRNCATNSDLKKLAQTELRSKAMRLRLSKVTDAGLDYLACLTKTTCLDLMFSKVSDRGLSKLTPLTRLTELNLSNTRIRRLDYLPALARLRDLDLASSPITDAGLASLPRQRALEELRLSETKISAKGLRHVAKLPRLRKLSLVNCRIDDAGLHALQKAPRLKELDLDGTRITDHGISLLPGMRLHELDLCNTTITDHSLPYLTKLRRLQELNLRDTGVSQEAIDRLRSALPNCSVRGGS